MIKADITVREIRKDNAVIQCMRAQTWEDLVARIQKDFKMADVFTEGSSIVIAAVKEQFDTVFSKVNDFFNNNAVIQEFVPMRCGIVEVLRNYAHSEINRIELDHSRFQVKISLEAGQGRSGYNLTATKPGIGSVRDDMKRLADSVKTRDHRLKELAHVKYVKDSRHAVIGAASKNHTVVKFSDEERPSHSFSSVSVYSKAVLANGKIIQLVSGNIVHCPADVVVNAANSRLEHGSGVAGAISKAGKHTQYIPDVDQFSAVF